MILGATRKAPHERATLTVLTEVQKSVCLVACEYNATRANRACSVGFVWVIGWLVAASRPVYVCMYGSDEHGRLTRVNVCQQALTHVWAVRVAYTVLRPLSGNAHAARAQLGCMGSPSIRPPTHASPVYVLHR